MTSRRSAILALAALAASRVGGAQEKGRPKRVGFISGYTQVDPQSPIWLRDGLRKLGFEEGRNLILERRYTNFEEAKVPVFVGELVRLPVDVLVCNSNGSIAVAQKATRTIPIVMHYGIAPVEAGFVKSLARPGGNISGNAFHSSETAAKIFDTFLEAFPKARSVVQLWNPSRAGYDSYDRILQAIAAQRGLKFANAPVLAEQELAGALQRIETIKPDLLIVANDVAFSKRSSEIAEFAIRHKLPTVGTVSDWVDLGGLMYSGPDESEPAQRTPRYVAAILNGARPEDLPVQLPSVYKLALNAKTAAALGYTFPQAMQLRADRIIQ